MVTEIQTSLAKFKPPLFKEKFLKPKNKHISECSLKIDFRHQQGVNPVYLDTS